MATSGLRRVFGSDSTPSSLILRAKSSRAATRFGRVLVGCLAAVCLSGVCTAADEPDAGAFDAKKWTLRRSIDVRLRGGPARALLLRAVSSTGTSGMGDPMFAVSLLVVAGDRVIQQYDPLPTNRSFHVNDELAAMDVTGDGVDEILFDSGFQGVSDWEYTRHVLYEIEATGALWDVAPQEFASGRRQTFRWLDAAGRKLALVAEPLDPPGPDDPHGCHSCSKFYQYLVFAWRKDRSAMVLIQAMQSEREFEDGDDPLQRDIQFIVAALSPEGRKNEADSFQ
jgi:hypothetical protein